jgi:hypothetical protein
MTRPATPSMRARPAWVALAALAVTTLMAGPAQAAAVFNWVQSGIPQTVSNEYRSFSVAVADDVYLAAQAAPVTFGKITTLVGSPATPRLSVTVGSADVLVQVFTAGIQGLSDGLYDLDVALPLCNSAPLWSGLCIPVFASSAVQPSGFSNFFDWGGIGSLNVRNSYSFILNGARLAVSTSVGPDNMGYLTPDSSGKGEFGFDGGDGSPVRGQGYWELDISTIPAALPLPPSAWLMGFGLVGVALRARPTRLAH